MEPHQEPRQAPAGNRPFYWALAVLAVGLFAAAGYLLGGPLGDAAALRGAILLTVSLAAVAVALVLVLGAVLQGHTPGRDRGFARGREVLLPLVGILGTIVGYVLGRDDGGHRPEPALTVVSRVDPATADGWAVATTFIEGGKPPYTYRLAMEGAAKEPFSGQTNARLLQHSIRLPAAATSLVTTVTDAGGQRSEAVVPLAAASGQTETPAPGAADGAAATGGAAAAGDNGPSVAYGQPVLKARIRYDADGWVEAVEFLPDTPASLPLVHFGRQPLNGPGKLLAHVWPEGADEDGGWLTEPVTVQFRGSGASVEFSTSPVVETNLRAAIVAVLMEGLNRSTAAERLLVDAALIFGEHDSYSLPGLLTIELEEEEAAEGPVVAPPVEQDAAPPAGQP